MTRSQRDRHSRSCQTGVLIQMNADVAQDLDLQPEELSGVKQLIVDPNLVQNVTSAEVENNQIESNNEAATNQNVMAVNSIVAITDSNVVQQGSDGQHISLEPPAEEQQTIILLVNGDQEGGESVMLDRALLQQRVGGEPGTYQIIQTFVDGDEQQMMPGNTLSIPEGYEVVLESNYPVSETQ